jgi:hypothetical protein
LTVFKQNFILEEANQVWWHCNKNLNNVDNKWQMNALLNFDSFWFSNVMMFSFDCLFCQMKPQILIVFFVKWNCMHTKAHFKFVLALSDHRSGVMTTSPQGKNKHTFDSWSSIWGHKKSKWCMCQQSICLSAVGNSFFVGLRLSVTGHQLWWQSSDCTVLDQWQDNRCKWGCVHFCCSLSHLQWTRTGLHCSVNDTGPTCCEFITFTDAFVNSIAVFVQFTAFPASPTLQHVVSRRKK